jgi:glutamate N-acetyltransferase/amino-acid N-acetyltransferase
VKTAIAGSDPNWGRILSAAGYSGVEFDPRDVSVYLQEVEVCKAGLAAEYDEDSLKKALDQGRVSIRVQHRKQGKGEARFFTCDLTEEYIRINGSYRT